MTKRKPGEIVRAEVKRLRNPHQHRLYWALIGLCFEHQTQFATRDQLHNAVKVWLGYCDTVTDKAGREIAIPKSIAFGNMPADQWHDFFNRFIALVCERIIPGTDDAELRATLEDMVGVPHG